MKKLYVQMVGRGVRHKPQRFVTAPCAWCARWHKLNELYVVGLNDRKVRICKSCLSK